MNQQVMAYKNVIWSFSRASGGVADGEGVYLNCDRQG